MTRVTVTAVGGNLFEIAAVQLGSALQWVNLAQANGLSDPFLTGTNVLTIPPTNQAFSGGVGQQ